MSQFIEYQEKAYIGGDRLNSVVNKEVGSYLKNNILNNEDKERFLEIENMKSEFRNQNRFVNSNRCRCFDETHSDDSDDDSNENYRKSIVLDPYDEDKGSKKYNPYIIKNNSTETFKDTSKDIYKDTENDNELIEDCELSTSSKNNTTLLIVFIVLLIIVIGLIMLLKFTKSNSIVDLIKKARNNQ